MVNRNLYSNTEFSRMKEAINKEIKRRGTFKWWDPLTSPKVGVDRTSPEVIPKDQGIMVDDQTYTINNPSHGALEPTRNTTHPAHGENPAGGPKNIMGSNPDTSAARFNVDEIKNYLVGLAKIQDINLFYGRDEVAGTAFRDPQGIEDVLKMAQASELNRPLHESDLSPIKIDPNHGITNDIYDPDNDFHGDYVTGLPDSLDINPDELDYVGSDDVTATIGFMHHGGYVVKYPKEDGKYVMHSGEYDGDETVDDRGPTERNFFDDHGASIIDSGLLTPDGQHILISDSSHHPHNPAKSQLVNRDWNDQQNSREDKPTKKQEGGKPSSRFGPNPRNPQRGEQYRSRPVFGGVLGACNVACTGLCYQTCDNECSESCTTTCWNRCGNACTASCGNVCTGCTTMCYTSCKTKCESSLGYACLKAGARTVKITSVGSKIGSSGSPGNDGWPKNTISSTTYGCNGCSYTCQFYPNKRTTCWDAACQEMCFTSCYTYCSSTCFGGCIDNANENNGNWKKGVGRGCSSGCTVNCIGTCHGVCIGECIHTCYHACKNQCHDNCSRTCSTDCGSGCANSCKNGCTGCDSSCSDTCKGKTSADSCTGCGWSGGCTSTCQHDCNTNCIGWGCRSVCGVESSGSCEANCRISCISQTCSSMCGQACASQCTTCVNNCGLQCGPCTSKCSIGCGADCNITCSERCQHSCDLGCSNSCSEQCGGCSNLCYSCVGMCIGTCSVKCENGCSSCTKNCGMWCDSNCSRDCFSNCADRCISTCSGSCASSMGVKTTTRLEGADRDPTAEGYHTPHPSNREEERDSFRYKWLGEQGIPSIPPPPEKDYLIEVEIDRDGNIEVKRPSDLEYVVYSTSVIGGVHHMEDDGEITIDDEMLPGLIESMQPNVNVDNSDTIFLILIEYNEDYDITLEDIKLKRLPFGLEYLPPLRDSKGNTIIIIARIDWDFRVDELLRLK